MFDFVFEVVLASYFSICRIFLLRLPYIIFQGGMPRASYGDRHSISVIHGSQQIAFDFTSRVIDFFIIFSSEPTAGMWLQVITEELEYLCSHLEIYLV